MAQLNQVYAALQLEQPEVAKDLKCLRTRAKTSYPLHAGNSESQVQSSAIHLRLSSVLDRKQVPHRNEHHVSDTLRVDIWIEDTPLIFEVDGPAHFVFPVDDPSPKRRCAWFNGATRLRQRLLRCAGFMPVSVKYSDLNAM